MYILLLLLYIIIIIIIKTLKNQYLMNSLVGQWIGLCAFSAKASGLIPNWGAKTPKATWYSQKKNQYQTNQVRKGN